MQIKNPRPLLSRGLINGGLVELTPTMIDRYNDCLESLGIERTERKKVFVDGVGWSPQVAQETKNPYYLCAGGIVNPVAIILSPDQYKKPVYQPLFSWMRGAMRLFFEKYHREIHDITGTHAITIDFEDRLTSLTCAYDLLYLSAVELVPNTDQLAEHAEEQKALVAECMEGVRCLDFDVRSRIVAHRKKYGDLRHRRLAVQSVAFDFCNDFHTVAFGGATVIRGVLGEDLLIVHDSESVNLCEMPAHSRALFFEDESHEWAERLRKAQMLEVPIAKYQKFPELLERKRSLLLGMTLCDCDPAVDWETITEARRKTLVEKHKDKVPEIFQELERFMVQVRRGDAPKVSQDLWFFLAEPCDHVPPPTQEVLWILLAEKQPLRVLNLYRHVKQRFYREYSTWSLKKQEWVAAYIAKHLIPRT